MEDAEWKMPKGSERAGAVGGWIGREGWRGTGPVKCGDRPL